MNAGAMRVALNLSIVVFVVCLFLAPRLPFQDYADWIYQAKVYKEILASNEKYSSNFAIRAPVIPNSAMTIIMGLLSFLVSPDLAGRIFTAGTFLLLFFGLRRVFSALEIDTTTAGAFAAFFTPSIFFFYGFLAFNFGLGLYLLFVPRPPLLKRKWANIAFQAVLFLILYYIHFIVLAAAVVTIFLLRIFGGEKRRFDIKSTAIGLLPVIILFVVYLAKYSRELGSGTIWRYNLFSKLGLYYFSLAVYYRFNDFASTLEMILIVIVNLSVMAALFAFIHYRLSGKYRAALGSPIMKLGFAFIIMGLAMPYSIMGFGQFGRPFWLGIVFLCAAALAVGGKLSGKLTKMIILISVVLILVRAAAIVQQGIDDKRFEQTIEKTIPNGTRFSYLMTKSDFPEYYQKSFGIRKLLLRICPNINTYHRVPLFIYTDRDEVCRGIFRTGILKFDSLECDFRSIIAGRQRPVLPECRNLLFVSPDGFSDSLFTDLRHHFDLVATGRGFVYATYRDSVWEGDH